ncbi:autotransporter outer membrane beta-barrel domain-containing protein [Stenotrophomonas sp. HMWF023]|nr:autotransporter outer membrane beta-barrel domain-containing protein [Stenotrophomonas sp. HMWF023]
MAWTANVHAQQVVADGDTKNPAAGDYTTTEPVDPGSTAGYAFHALNGGQIVPTGAVNLSTSGAGAAAARAEGAGSRIELVDATVTTIGDRASGISVADGAHVEISGASTVISTQGRYSHGVQVATGSTANVGGVKINVSGDDAVGVFAQSGASVQMSGTQISTTGQYGSAIESHEAHVELSGVNVETTGMAGIGLRMSKSNGAGSNTGLVSNSTITTHGASAWAINVQGNSSLEVQGSTLVTHGYNAWGITVGGGVVSLIDTNIFTSGETANGVDMSGGEFYMQGGRIEAKGKNAEGVHLHQSNSSAWLTGTTIISDGVGVNVNGYSQKAFLDGVDLTSGATAVWLPDDSTIDIANSSLHTTNKSALGVDTRAGRVTLSNTAISTEGDFSYGVYASKEYSSRASIDATGIDIRTVGTGSTGAVARLGGYVSLSDSRIVTTGEKAYGLRSEGTGELSITNTHVRTAGLGAYGALVDKNGYLAIDGGSLVSDSHGAMWIRSARHVSASNGAVLIGGNGVLASIDAAQSSPLALAFSGDVYAQGDIVITAEDIAAGIPVTADVHVGLDQRSHWQGATGIVNAMNISGGSQWTLTGDSTVQSMALNNSTLALSAIDGGRFNTLTVAGDFDTSAGHLVFNGALGDDGARTDRLHVVGDTNGQADVTVNNVGGAGGQTQQGIQLIQVDGASNARYDLIGRAVGGQYEYFLHKAADGGWYLQSSLLPVDPCIADPGGPTCPVIQPPVDLCQASPTDPRCNPTIDPPVVPPVLPPVIPVLRPEPGAYLANQNAAVQLFQHRAHDRNVGGDRGAWVQVNRNEADYGVIGDQLDVSSDSNVLQIGSDVWGWGQSSRGVVGVMLANGDATSQIRSKLTGYSANGKVHGNAVGIYGSWQQRPKQLGGGYVDGWLQHGRYSSSVQGEALQKERYHARTASASIEAGYAFTLRQTGASSLYLEPQVQLNYTDYRSDRITERNGTVIDGENAGGLSTRVGLRLYGQANVGRSRVQPFLEANWLHADGDNALDFDGERLQGGVPSRRVELKAGAQLQLGGRWSAWGDMGVQSGSGGYRNLGAQLGVRRSW